MKNVLILFEFDRFILGDSCDRIAKLKACKYIFPNSSVDFGTNQLGFRDLLLNNPYISRTFFEFNYDDIDFAKYQVVICVSNREQLLIEHLHTRYGNAIIKNELPLVVFSARNLYDQQDSISFLFPALPVSPLPNIFRKEGFKNEIFISEGEREWADKWFENAGVIDDDLLIVVVDSSNSRSKLMSVPNHFSLLNNLLLNKRVKIVVFDENGRDKKSFYKIWLGNGLEQRFIFCENTSLRQSLCLLGSRYLKFIIGPCSGLLHCVSGIYNSFLQRGGDPQDLPAMLVYRGSQKGINDNPFRWWGNSLVDCVLVKSDFNNKPYLQLLSKSDLDINNALNGLTGCDQISSEILVQYIKTAYKGKFVVN